MTYVMRDDTPDDWSKMDFSSAYLPYVDGYISEHNVKACIRGAISLGALGAGAAKICFSDAKECATFKSWYDVNVRYWERCSKSYMSRNNYV